MALLGMPDEILLSMGDLLSDADLGSLVKTNYRLFQALIWTLYSRCSTASLHQAVRQGQEAAVHAILRRTAIDGTGRTVPHGPTALHIAAENGFPSIIRILIHHGAADVEATAAYGFVEEYQNARPLHCAVRHGRAAVVALLIELGVELDSTVKSASDQDATALHIAVEYGYGSIVTQLLDAGANKEAAASWTDEKKVRPLHIAVWHGREEILSHLLHAGATVHATIDDTEGMFLSRHPLHMAADYGQLGCTTILLEHGTEVDARCGRGWTALMYAAREGHVEIVKQLLRYGSDGGIVCNGWDALRLACSNGHAPLAELLVHDVRGPATAAALHEAVLSERVAVVQVLADMGADVDAGNPRLEAGDGDVRPLHAAVLVRRLDVLALLLSRGADINALDGQAKRPLQVAVEASWSEGTKLLLAAEDASMVGGARLINYIPQGCRERILTCPSVTYARCS